MNTRVRDAAQLINTMNSEELEEIVTEIKQRRTRLARQTTRSLRKNSTVQFTTRTGRPVTGTVTKVNPKTVIVHEAGYGKWKVSASLLTVVDTETV